MGYFYDIPNQENNEYKYDLPTFYNPDGVQAAEYDDPSAGYKYDLPTFYDPDSEQTTEPSSGFYVNSRPVDEEKSAGRSLGSATRAARAASGGTDRNNSDYWTIGKLPTPEYGTFTAPARDPNRIGALRAKASGAGLRDLRRQTQQAIQGTSGMDATMRRMTLKDALMGYGSGVSKIMGQADRIAQSQYEQEYGDKYRESMLNYTTGISKANMEYQAELQKLVRNAGLGANLNMNVLNYTKPRNQI
jgi:hypothetical protein